MLKANDVTIIGQPGTRIHGQAYKNKAALVVRGKRTTIRQIECFNIQVKDKNGACVRLIGRDLTLDNVYFHDAEQGLLTGGKPGIVKIINSRFENLGRIGRAHGIYVGGGQLFIQNSHFLSSKDEGHEIKSRAAVTVIERSVIASLSGNDSRLIDIPNGGELRVVDSILQQGPNSENWNLIGYGLEGYKHKDNRITLVGNIVLMDRSSNRFLQIKRDKVEPEIRSNAFIGPVKDRYGGNNLYFDDRDAAQLPDFPFLPALEK
ncbi:hypothetical protein LJ739_01305 [Aestuariibacter halophilus]|uniref:Right handed beta helix domain-containing protein n=1 Tax=Fluctibacter halophilus TaxID=226011 RepID=A0ABS8G5C4_9ALTE|nr:hypothetical protein [Aestuariibacter halophilus]MCC2614874.1 hypothetical protein [Aestuariibacter halophilus]